MLSGFERVKESRDLMRSITLDEGEAEVFARARCPSSTTTRTSPRPSPNRKS